jgi:hypothetical protein
MNAKDLKSREPRLYRSVYRSGHDTGYNRALINLKAIMQIFPGDPTAAVKSFLAGETPLDIAIKQRKQLSMIEKKPDILTQGTDINTAGNKAPHASPGQSVAEDPGG